MKSEVWFHLMAGTINDFEGICETYFHVRVHYTSDEIIHSLCLSILNTDFFVLGLVANVFHSPGDKEYGFDLYRAFL